MSATKHALAKDVFRASHLRGEFKLRSGQISNEYFDKYQFESDPRLLSKIAELMKPLIPAGTDFLGALEMGGIPIATALSLISGIPVVFVRKSAKDYGTCKFAEGPSVRGKKVCLIEDVITTGGQVVTSATDLRADGAIIDTVLCVIDRSEGQFEKLRSANLNHVALFSMAELKEAGGAI